MKIKGMESSCCGASRHTTSIQGRHHKKKIERHITVTLRNLKIGGSVSQENRAQIQLGPLSSTGLPGLTPLVFTQPYCHAWPVTHTRQIFVTSSSHYVHV